ncbi:VrrA/YqfQ family protein [Alkalibacillus silvisoli]|uniref:YqfQ-like protein n=1 Tax=Alkalibacillus silvisoli TaxID=392823 RepID=A0ABN0ZUF7_9BACI
MYPARPNPHNYWNQPAQPPMRHHGYPKPNIIHQFLSKIKGPGPTPKGPFHAPITPFQYGASNYHGLHGTLNQIQKGLGMVQQVLPLWKQYGPLIKNAPMFIDMVKLMMEEDETKDPKVEKEEASKDELIKQLEDDIKQESGFVKKGDEKQKTAELEQHPRGLPKPKLYI